MAPTLINGSCGVEVYPKLVRYVLEGGAQRPSRNGDTLDLGHVITHLASPVAALPLGVNRSLNRKVAAAEAAQLIGGFSDPELMLRASPNFAQYMEPGRGVFHGAYGIRIGHQLPAVIHKLSVDGNTRQAVITLWDPAIDNTPGKLDYPCTVMFQFDISDGYHLNMNTVMRSNDVWLGVPYDWFQFTQLQLTMANILGVQPGTYTHQSFSTHLYVKDIEKAGKLFTSPTDGGFTESRSIEGFGVYGENAVFKVMQRAKQVTRGDLPESSNTERWYRQQFRPTPHPSQLGNDLAQGSEGPQREKFVQS